MHDRFDLEDAISNAWRVIDNIETLQFVVQRIVNDTNGHISPEYVDEHLEAIKTTHQLAMDKLHTVFNDMIENRQID